MHHLKGNFNFNSTVAKVSRHPKDPKRWGLTNTGADNWTLSKKDGESVVVAPGKTAPLQSGAKINFGPIEGLIN